MSNIAQLKAQLNMTSLPMVRVMDTEKKPTAWLATWDNDNRVRVVIHEDLLPTVTKEEGLFLKTETKKAETSGLKYTLHIICRSSQTPEVVL